jgi:threonine dehydrogenase-like Zn-dependent dehydrogenase
MKAIAITPGKKDSLRVIEIPKPHLQAVSENRGVLVKILQVGLDGTDKELIDAEYGEAPSGDDYLIIGHESLGIVEQVGNTVIELYPGDLVTATVRRPGTSVYDKMGIPDFTTDDVYFERGINRLHGYLTEYYVESPENLIRVPNRLKDVGVLLEPMSIVEKGIYQAFLIQDRLKVWNPKKALVMGAGTLGLLATLILRLRGIEVTAIARTKPSYLNSDLVETIDGRYLSTKQASLKEAARTHGPFDIIVEATGYSPLMFEAMEILAKNGILILSSITGGDRKVEVAADRINLGFVLGNKLCFGTVNANRFHFELAIKDLGQASLQFPGWPNKLLTHPINGFDSIKVNEVLQRKPKGMIKSYCKIAPIE